MIGHQIVLTGKIISDPKITTGQYGSTAGFAIASTDDHVFYGMLKLGKPNRYTDQNGLPLTLKKMGLGTVYGMIDGYLKDDEKVPSSYMVKFSNFYPYSHGKTINTAQGTGSILRVAKLENSPYYKFLMREAKKKMKPTDEVKYRYYTLMVTDTVITEDMVKFIKDTLNRNENIITTWTGKIARGEKLLNQEIDKTKPALNTINVSSLVI